MSSTRVPLRPIGASVGRLLVLVAALAGLFAMHGLSDHGVGGPDAAVVEAGGSPVMTSVGDAMAVGGHVSGTAVEAPGGQPMQDEHEMGLVELCLAVLVAVLLIGLSVWLLALLLRSVGLSHWRPRRLVPARQGPLRPPDLLALSIQRC